ncbi:MAG: hypothetical protein AAGI12_11815 [Pseudomonadota bacterium]
MHYLWLKILVAFFIILSIESDGVSAYAASDHAWCSILKPGQSVAVDRHGKKARSYRKTKHVFFRTTLKTRRDKKYIVGSATYYKGRYEAKYVTFKRQKGFSDCKNRSVSSRTRHVIDEDFQNFHAKGKSASNNINDIHFSYSRNCIKTKRNRERFGLNFDRRGEKFIFKPRKRTLFGISLSSRTSKIKTLRGGLQSIIAQSKNDKGCFKVVVPLRTINHPTFWRARDWTPTRTVFRIRDLKKQGKVHTLDLYWRTLANN